MTQYNIWHNITYEGAPVIRTWRDLSAAQLRSVLIISIHTTSSWGSQIPKPLIMSNSKHPLKVWISQGLGPFFQIVLLKTGCVGCFLLARGGAGGCALNALEFQCAERDSLSELFLWEKLPYNQCIWCNIYIYIYTHIYIHTHTHFMYSLLPLNSIIIIIIIIIIIVIIIIIMHIIIIIISSSSSSSSGSSSGSSNIHIIVIVAIILLSEPAGGPHQVAQRPRPRGKAAAFAAPTVRPGAYTYIYICIYIYMYIYFSCFYCFISVYFLFLFIFFIFLFIYFRFVVIIYIYIYIYICKQLCISYVSYNVIVQCITLTKPLRLQQPTVRPWAEGK